MIAQSPELQLTVEAVVALTEQPLACACMDAIAVNAVAIAGTSLFCLGIRLLFVFIISLSWSQ
ncbi:protein of unknown function [Burkholderia multivorans]